MKRFITEWRATSTQRKVLFVVVIMAEIFFGVSSVGFALAFAKTINENPDPALSYFAMTVTTFAVMVFFGRINIFKGK